MTKKRPVPDNLSRAVLEELYGSRPFIEAYREHTDRLVAHDPQIAVGGLWEEIGKLQFDYLVANGLRPEHRLLDIGCGTMRGGRHFIRYLGAGNYTGFDLSAASIEAARRIVAAEGLTSKRPNLYVDGERLDLRLAQGQKFDFLLAQSVFTHLPEDDIAICCRALHTVMEKHSKFFFTFDDPVDFEGQRKPLHVFYHPFDVFERLAAECDLTVERRFDYPHPRNQSMAVLSLRASIP